MCWRQVSRGGVGRQGGGVGEVMGKSTPIILLVCDRPIAQYTKMTSSLPHLFSGKFVLL